MSILNPFSDPFSDSFQFSFFNLGFFLIFGAIITIILYNVIKGLRVWIINNNSPLEALHSKIIGKRTHVSKHYDSTNFTTTSSTSYYITFELEDNSRIELKVKAKTYGLLSENDTGILEFQGTRFLDFNRDFSHIT